MRKNRQLWRYYTPQKNEVFQISLVNMTKSTVLMENFIFCVVSVAIYVQHRILHTTPTNIFH